MATVSRSRRAASAIAMIVAGALLVLAVLLPLLGLTVPWLIVLAHAALAVAFGILGFGAVNNTVAKVALIAAAVGWAILAISGLGLALPAPLITIAAIMAGVGGLIGAIVLYVGKEVLNRPAIVFIVATALGLIYVLGVIGVFAYGAASVLFTALFGLALIAAGFLFRRTERTRA